MIRKLTLALVTLCLLTASVAPAAAQSDEDDSSVVTVVVSIVSSPLDFAEGLAAKASSVANVFREEPDAEEEATKLRTYLNDNEPAFVNHTNDVIDEHNYSVGNGTYTYELTIDGEESNETLYLVSTADGTNVTGYTVVNETNNTVSRSFSISAFQAEDLNEDVREYKDEYVDADEVPDKGYYVSKAVQYSDWSKLTGSDDD